MFNFISHANKVNLSIFSRNKMYLFTIIKLLIIKKISFKIKYIQKIINCIIDSTEILTKLKTKLL